MRARARSATPAAARQPRHPCGPAGCLIVYIEYLDVSWVLECRAFLVGGGRVRRTWHACAMQVDSEDSHPSHPTCLKNHASWGSVRNSGVL
eukprot:1279240-Lingulodinium_polyedra.AAC.1